MLFTLARGKRLSFMYWMYGTDHLAKRKWELEEKLRIDWNLAVDVYREYMIIIV